MKITTLQYFVSAAELNSFTKAAKKHFVAQTAISQQMAKLEQQLGVSLFVRETNRVVLTDAGHVFYEDIKNILREYEFAMKKVNQFHQDQKKVITIGYKERSELNLLSTVIKDFQQTYPQIEFVIKEGSPFELAEEVKHGLCDLFVNISCTFSMADLEGLEQYTIYQGSMVLGVSIDHPKAKFPYIEASELSNEKYIMLNVDNSFRGFEQMYHNCKEDGYEIQISQYAPNIGAQLMMVGLNKGVTFLQDLMVDTKEERIRYLPIRHSAHQYEVDIIWNQSNRDPFLQKFLHSIKKTLPIEGV